MTDSELYDGEATGSLFQIDSTSSEMYMFCLDPLNFTHILQNYFTVAGRSCQINSTY